jgi:hypothetical protein
MTFVGWKLSQLIKTISRQNQFRVQCLKDADDIDQTLGRQHRFDEHQGGLRSCP